MAKTSIYLPDDLAEHVRTYGISISEVAQGALRQAVEMAHLRESVMTDMQAVAERLRQTRRADAAAEQATNDKARQAGSKWARETATAAELEYVATFDGPFSGFRTPNSMIGHAPNDKRWPHFQAGAREIWEAVRPMLAEPDEHAPGLPRPLMDAPTFTRPLRNTLSE